jgi:hypothetical protein
MQRYQLPRWRLSAATLACAALTAISAPAASATPTPGSIQPPVVIDDFTSGAYSITTTAPSEQKGQAGSMAGESRCLRLDTPDNPFGRPNSLSVGDGHLLVETGVRVNHALTVLYGFDAQCQNRPMDLDVSTLDRFRIDFDLVDLPLAGAMAVWSPSGVSSIPICGTGVAPEMPFCEMPFSGFGGDADFKHIQYIAIVFESAGTTFAHDYALTSIRAVRGEQPSVAPRRSVTRTSTVPRPLSIPSLPRPRR